MRDKVNLEKWLITKKQVRIDLKMRSLIALMCGSVICWMYMIGNNNRSTNICGLPETGKKLAIIIPYRDRKDHLTTFIHVMDSFMKNTGIDYTLIVVEQHGGRPFNRGILFNIGFSLEYKDFDYFCFHDVDMVPAELCIDYSYPQYKARHLAVNLQQNNFTRKNYSVDGTPLEYYGGVLCIDKLAFNRTNGFSNKFWGWGAEDDDFARRLKMASIPLEIAEHGYYFSIRLNHGKRNKVFYQTNIMRLKDTEKDWDKDGLNSLAFTLKKSGLYLNYKYYLVDALYDLQRRKERGVDRVQDNIQFNGEIND